jgi:hypothetical protein
MASLSLGGSRLLDPLIYGPERQLHTPQPPFRPTNHRRRSRG